MSDKDSVISATRFWIEQVVIGLNFCPFARREVEKNRVRYSVCESGKKKGVLECFLSECRLLDDDNNIETTLLILPRGYSDFSIYLDVLDLIQQLLEAEGYEGVYQLASLHPDYCFEGEDFDDPANFTNRSPYPMIHILREQSLERALGAHPDPESIPERNIKLAREMGFDQMLALLVRSTL